MSDKIPAIDLGATPSKDAEPASVSHKQHTVELYASKRKIYVRKVRGFFQKIRKKTLILLLAAYFGICWISIGGQQLVLFDLPNRQFHIFGTTFWPQDFVLLAWLLIISAFALFFVTTLFGRVWCGYTCPQTAWTLMYIWIEEKIEGSRNQRMKLDAGPMTPTKLRKKSLKHAAWFSIALVTGLTFVGYFYPIRALVPDLFTFNLDSGWALFWILFFTAATYLNAGWMREQVCLYMCPYARFQSVMFDQDTMIVSYDPGRGEPRGGRQRDANPAELGLGDCIDCNMCVQVCPTGIDIRDGLQYECIGCALCVDACDGIMDKMNYPRGLISYTTEKALKGRASHFLRPRTLGYAAALLLMCAAFVLKLGLRSDIQVDVIRDRGALFQTNARGFIENSYTLQILNKSNEERGFKISVSGANGLQLASKDTVWLTPSEVRTVPAVVEIDPAQLTTRNMDIEFQVTLIGDEEVRASHESRFLSPGPER